MQSRNKKSIAGHLDSSVTDQLQQHFNIHFSCGLLSAILMVPQSSDTKASERQLSCQKSGWDRQQDIAVWMNVCHCHFFTCSGFSSA